MRNVTSAVSLYAIAAILRADCPTPPVPYAWSAETPIYYSWPNSNPPPAYTALSVDDLGIAGDVNSAFNQWNYADQTENSTNNTFYYSASGTPLTVYVYRVNYPGVPGEGDPLQAARYTMAKYTGTDIVAAQAIYMYFGATCASGTYTCWDQNAADFHEFVQKVMVHEIGHGMGLTDQPINTSLNCDGQSAGQSVMNEQCGTNDSMGNLPVPAPGLPACDNASVH